jgi:hypothetical protein
LNESSDLEFSAAVYVDVEQPPWGPHAMTGMLLDKRTNDSFLSAQASGVPIEELLAAP